MRLTELVTYATTHYPVREKTVWEQFPGASVLFDTDTGKWAALLMRQWDTDTGEMLERCDMRCGGRTLQTGGLYFLRHPFRMKGEAWFGLIIDEYTIREDVFRLFDLAMERIRKERFTIVLKRGSDLQSTAIPPAGSRPQPGPARRPGQPPQSPGPGPAPLPREADSDPVPAKILEMMSLYEYGSMTLYEKSRNFCRQGRFMAAYEDDYPWPEKYRHYYPTYHDLNVAQLRGYFTWRKYVRRGDFRPAPTSLAYIYLYELLNEIGTASPEDALEKMDAFEKGFLDSGIGDRQIRENLRKWRFGFAVVHQVDPAITRGYMDPWEREQDEPLSVLKEPLQHTDDEVFRALTEMDGGKLKRSVSVKREPDRAVRFFAAVWRTTLREYAESGDDFFEACFGRPQDYYFEPFSNAVYWAQPAREDVDYELYPCRHFLRINGLWRDARYTPRDYDKRKLRALVREADRIFREVMQLGHPLSKKPEEAWADCFIRDALEQLRQEEIEQKRQAVTIDLSGLSHIRQDAAITRDSLLTEEEKAETEAAPGASTLNDASPAEYEPPVEAAEPAEHESPAEAASPAAAPAQPGEPDDLVRDVLALLLQGKPAEGYVKERHLLPSVVADTINAACWDEIGDNVLEYDGTQITLVEDYREDLEEYMEERNA